MSQVRGYLIDGGQIHDAHCDNYTIHLQVKTALDMAKLTKIAYYFSRCKFGFVNLLVLEKTAVNLPLQQNIFLSPSIIRGSNIFKSSQIGE